MSAFRKSLLLVVVASLMSVGVLANEPTEEKEKGPVTPAKIEAAEKKAMTPEKAEALQKMINAPAGVFDPEYAKDGDKNGDLLRLKIKGEVAVSRALTQARAEIAARQSAERNAKAAFVKFLKEEVSVKENEKEEIIIIEKDGEEQAGYKNISTREIETKANGLLRGLIVLDERYTGEGASRKATVVYGWSKKLADAARTAQAEMARERNPAAVRPGATTGSANTPSTGDKAKTAEDLTDF
jgi:hypothetical protein